MAELGIVDIREIIRAVKSTYDVDFSQYALTSFKQRLERFMNLYGITGSESLIRKLNAENDFIDTFLFEISVPSTEMFRDPSLWRWLREEYFPNALERTHGRFKIWLPACVSGGELFTLAILLHESEWLDKVQIIAGCLSDKSISLIRSGLYDLKKIEISEENYTRFNGTSRFSNYYKSGQNGAYRDTSLISEVEFIKVNPNFEYVPQNARLILFRNSMIYYNPGQQDKVLHILSDSLSAAGHLITGIREKITPISSSRDFEAVNATEGVYRKRISMFGNEL